MHHHHVIVGDGVTAAEFATTRNCKPGDSITVIGPNVNDLGRGVAYAKAPAESAWQYAYLLNSPARSVDPDFGNWLGEHWDELVAIMSGRSPNWLQAAQAYVDIGEYASLNVPREIFGDFFAARTLKKIEALRDQGVKVQTLATRVENIKPSPSGLTVFTKENHQIEAHTVDVATGGPMNQRFDGDNGENGFPELFGNEPEIADKIKTGGNVVCIGAGAAMLDLLRFCQSVQPEKHINFTAISPNGKTLAALRPSANFKPTRFDVTGTFKYADDFLSTVFELQRQAMAAGDSLYETRVGLRSLFMENSLIEFVPDLIEARKVARPLFKHFEGGTRDSIDDFNRLIQTGHTRLIKGRVQHIEHKDGQAWVHYANTSGQTTIMKATVVVNCAGSGRTNRFDTLTNNLLAAKSISICEQSGGILVGESGHTPIDGLRYLGPAVTSIGRSVEPVPLYDAFRLRRAVRKFNMFTEV